MEEGVEEGGEGEEGEGVMFALWAVRAHGEVSLSPGGQKSCAVHMGNFISSHDRSKAKKKYHQKTSGFSRLKSLLQRSDYTSLLKRLSDISETKQVINLTTGFNYIAVRDKRTNE